MKVEYKIGEDFNSEVFWYDEDGNKFSKEIKGKIIQVTKDFITINNGIYNESFKYSELIEDNDIQPEAEPYDTGIENYEKDILDMCISNIKNDLTGYVFNEKQANIILKFLKENEYKYETSVKNGLYFFKKI